jgi:GMP synthase (glutamine-hydrolysing)
VRGRPNHRGNHPPGEAPRLLVVEHEADAGLGRMEAPLAGVARLDIRRPYLGDAVPTDAAGSGFDGVVVLGGEMGALDDSTAPWLPAIRQMMAGSVRVRLPVLGICLGAQLLAAACGGRVERGTAGLEVGLVRIEPTLAALDDILLGPVTTALGDGPGQALSAAQYHQDAVVELPPDAVHLASGGSYRYQAFRIGPVAWGLQYHPEVTQEDFATWVRFGHGSLVGAGLDPRELLQAVIAAETSLRALAEEHAAAFAATLRTGVGRLR